MSGFIDKILFQNKESLGLPNMHWKEVFMRYVPLSSDKHKEVWPEIKDQHLLPNKAQFIYVDLRKPNPPKDFV